MENPDRAERIIKDILDNHLPRVKEGLEKGYVDENQVLIIYDHLVRVRIMREIAATQTFVREIKQVRKTRPPKEVLDQIAKEQAPSGPQPEPQSKPFIRCCPDATSDGVCQQHGMFEYYFDGQRHISISQGIGMADLGQWMLGSSKDFAFYLESPGEQPDIVLKADTVIDLKGVVRNFYSVPSATFGVPCPI